MLSDFWIVTKLSLSQFPDWRLQSIYLVSYTESVVGTMAKE